ncbi:MAG: hypothetical protein Q9169_001820 [Polycauliona sp. 2 TL-2023]
MLSSRCAPLPDHVPQRLSKPPTNTSASNLLAPRQRQESVSPLLTASDESADGYFPKMPTTADGKERHNRRSKIRSYIYGHSPESGHSSDDEESPRSFAHVVKRRLSRTDSASLTVGAAASAASSTSRLHLPDASSSDLDEHDAVKEQIMEKVWIDTLAAQNHVSIPIDEDKHPDSVKSPIRRRSLYTPGIATRSPEDILRKQPPPESIKSQVDRDYYYNPALPDSSPLSRLANLRSPQNGRSTPSELDYSHLGALQLGTLRVTNGTASPVPRERDIHGVYTEGTSIKRKPLPDRLVAREESREDAFSKLTKNQGARGGPNGIHSTRRNPTYGPLFDQQYGDSGYSSNVSLESPRMPSPTAALDSAVPPDGQVRAQSQYPVLLQTSRQLNSIPYSQGSDVPDLRGGEVYSQGRESEEESAGSDIMRSPSWSEYGNTKKKQQRKEAKAERDLQKQKKRESSCDPNADARSRSKPRSRSRFRSRSRKRSSRGEPVPTLTDFGTVSESLGAGPYDIAIACHTPIHQSPQSRLHPHQINTVNLGATPTVMPMNPIQHGRQRSYTSATVALSKSVLPELERPRSMYFESRPVPAIPMADLAQRRSTKTDGQAMANDNQMTDTARQSSSRTVGPTTTTGFEAVESPSVEMESEASSGPTNTLLTGKTDTMEELIDKLLEAPSHQARGTLLQQLRQVRHKSVMDSKIASRQADRNTITLSQEDVEVPVSQSTPLLLDTTHQQLGTTAAGESQVVKASDYDRMRHRSLFVDAPPMPRLPTTRDIYEHENRRSMEQLSKSSQTLIGPQTPAMGPSKTDLWAGCAIQTEHRKAIESSNDWDAHRSAWSHRRKSAGEALLRSSGTASPRASGEISREAEQPPVISRAMTEGFEGFEQPAGAKDGRRAFHKPWAPSPGQDASQEGSTGALQSDSKVAATAQRFERRSGRYEGGLLFGYEKGFGLGGSAGTRSATKTGATRKSVQMSQGFGVDLSDVPIFVAQSNSKSGQAWSGLKPESFQRCGQF